MVEIVLLTLVVATHQGCTLIGLGTGVAIDALTPSVEAAPRVECNEPASR